MPMPLKIALTAMAMLVASIIVLSDLKAGPTWHWRLGSYDPLRILLFRKDGRHRKYSKIGMFLRVSAFLTIFWRFA